MDITAVRAMCLWLSKLVPHQQFDDDTPEAWAPLLAHVAIEDARTAVMRILERERYVDPQAIRHETKRIRTRRLELVGIPAPNIDPDDATQRVAYRREQAALKQAVLDGRMDAAARADYERGGTTLTDAAPWRPVAELITRDLPRAITTAETSLP